MDVRCRKLYCKNNKGQTCVLKGFEINKHVCCDDYELDKSKIKKVKDISRTMFEKKVKFAPFKNIKKFNLTCKAKTCIFNERERCKSNGLTILAKEPSKATCCNYFEK